MIKTSHKKIIDLIVKDDKCFAEVKVNEDGSRRPLQPWKNSPEKLLTLEQASKRGNIVGAILADDIVRIDIDVHDFDNYVKAMDIDTLTIKTRKGLHLYFKDVNGLSKKYQKGDYILYNQIVAEFFPAGHSCLTYLWINDENKRVVKFNGNIAELDTWFLPMKKKTNTAITHLPLKKGHRDDAFFKMACTLKDKFTPSQIMDKFDLMNTHCNYTKELFDRKEIEDKLERVFNTYSTDESYYDEIINEKGKLLHTRVVDKIIENNIIYIVQEGGELIPVIWNLTHYKMYAEFEIKDKIRQMLPEEYINEGVLNSIFNLLKITPSLFKRWDDFQIYPYHVFFKDCVIDIRNKTMSDPSPAFFNTSCIDVEYKKLPYVDIKDTKFFKNFLARMKFADDDYQMLYEYISTVFVSSNQFKCFAVFEGESNCGKSLLCDSIRQIFGEENVSDVPLHDIGKQFIGSMMFNKKLNIDGDGKGSALKDTSAIKKMTGGEPMLNEVKRRVPWKYTNTAKCIFCFNSLPLQSSEDITLAFYNRLRLFKFTEVLRYSHDQATHIKKSMVECIPFFISLLNDVIENGVSSSKKSESEKLDLREESDNVLMFLKECTRKDVDAVCANDDLYESYVVFCSSYGYSSLNRVWFFRRIKYHTKKESVRKTINGKKAYYHEGITLREL